MPNNKSGSRHSNFPRQLAGIASGVFLIALGVQYFSNPTVRSNLKSVDSKISSAGFDPKPFMGGFEFYVPPKDYNDAKKLPPVGAIDPKILPPGFSVVELNFKQIEAGLDNLPREFLYRKTYLVYESTMTAMQADTNVRDDASRDQFLLANGGLLHSFNDAPSWVKIDPIENLILQRFWTNSGNFSRPSDLPAVITDKILVWKDIAGGTHRVNAPAHIGTDYLAWIENGVPHRADGPAVIGKKSVEYWWRGKKCTPEQYANLQKAVAVESQKKARDSR